MAAVKQENVQLQKKVTKQKSNIGREISKKNLVVKGIIDNKQESGQNQKIKYENYCRK